MDKLRACEADIPPTLLSRGAVGFRTAVLLTGRGLALVRWRLQRCSRLRTLGTAVLSILVVGMGASLGREGAPKQVGAVLANALSDRACLSDEQRRLLVACGAGAGMAAAYGVPLGARCLR
jgi:H+/Cl- antiporter ClcA